MRIMGFYDSESRGPVYQTQHEVGQREARPPTSSNLGQRWARPRCGGIASVDVCCACNQ